MTEQTIGQFLNINSEIGNSSLDIWLKSVLTKTVAQLTPKDCCIALRQGLGLEVFVPRALQILNEDPFAGDQFDGELFSCLFRSPRSFWQANTQLKKELAVIASKGILDF